MPALIGSFLIFILFVNHLVPFAMAAVSSCGAYVTPHQVRTSTNNVLDFTIQNTSSQSIVWIKITKPSSNFTVTGGSTPNNWTISYDDSSVTYTNRSIGAGETQAFSVNISIGSSSASIVAWTGQTSDDSAGANPTTCTGNTNVSITSSEEADETPPTISGVTVSDITGSSAKISWTTNEAATAVIYYGETNAYGSSKSNSSYNTSHSFELTGLSGNKTYHYKIDVMDQAGNDNQWGDSTFATAIIQPTPTPVTVTVYASATPVVTTVYVSPSPVPTPSPVIVFFEDKQPPQVSIETDLSNPFSQPPQIAGKVEDNKKGNVVEILYSLDGGRTWLPVDEFDTPGGEASAYRFLPEITDDGNYPILVQARDGQSNVGTSAEVTLIIDRLEPRIGGGFISLASLPLPLDQSGLTTTLVGLDHKITLGAVGGPTTIDIASGNQLFSLVKNLDTGLWSGTVSFEKPGLYELMGRAIDGAGRRTERVIATVQVLAKGKISHQNQALPQAEIRAYVFDKMSQTFTSWDGASFGQENPQQVEIDGEYKLELPAGRYYLSVSARSYKKLKTDIFNLDEATPVQLNFDLTKKQGFNIGPWYIDWFDFWPQTISVDPEAKRGLDQSVVQSVVGQQLPYLNLFGETELVNLASFRGQPTLLTFVTTWSPQTSQQLKILQDLKTNLFQIGVVFVQENLPTITIYKKRAQYDVDVYADPDGDLVTALNLFTYPTHIFLDRKGIVRDVTVGVLTGEEIVDKMVR